MHSSQNPAEILTKEDYELLAEFRYTLRKFLGFSENAALQHGVTPQQYQVLLAIKGFPDRDWVTMSELAEKMRIAHHSAVGMVDRMASQGLLERTASEADRRQVQVSVTKKGRGILDKLYRVHRAEHQSMGPHLMRLLQKSTAKLSTNDSPATQS